MKRYTVASFELGLVFENKNLVAVLEAGTYRFWGNKNVELLSKLTAITSKNMPTQVLLKDPLLERYLDIVEVGDTELALIYENGVFQSVLEPGQYGFWKGIVDRKVELVDISQVAIGESISKAVLEKQALQPFIRKVCVPNQHKGVLFIDGKFSELLEAGTYYYWRNAVGVEIKTVDTRIQQMEVSGQELLSKDKAVLRINFYVRFEVKDILKAVTANRDYDKQLYVMAQLGLREFVGALTLDELLNKKSDLGVEIMNLLSSKTLVLGVAMIDCGIRDIILPGEMKDILNQVLIAEKKAQANIIMRREETASTRSMLNTAKMMEENNMLRRLKEMEYVERIADKVGNISLSGNSDIIQQLKSIFVQPYK